MNKTEVLVDVIFSVWQTVNRLSTPRLSGAAGRVPPAWLPFWAGLAAPPLGVELWLKPAELSRFGKPSDDITRFAPRPLWSRIRGRVTAHELSQAGAREPAPGR